MAQTQSVWKGLTAYKPSFALVTVSAEDLLQAVNQTVHIAPRVDAVGQSESLICSMNHYRIARALGTCFDDSTPPIEARVNLVLLGLQLVLAVTKADIAEKWKVTDEALVAAALQFLVSVGHEKERVALEPTALVESGLLPLFLTSTVNSLRGIDRLRQYLGFLSGPRLPEIGSIDERCACLHLREYFNVGGVGVVGGGVCEYGILREGDVVCIGPDSRSKFAEVVISSIRSEQGLRAKCVSANQTACLAFDLPSSYHSGASAYSSSTSDDEDMANVCRRGACIFSVHSGMRAVVVREFEIEILDIVDLLYSGAQEAVAVSKDKGEQSAMVVRGRTQIQSNAHFVVHSNAVRQSAVVTDVKDNMLCLQFCKRGECLVDKAKVLLSNGATVVLGRVRISLVHR